MGATLPFRTWNTRAGTDSPSEIVFVAPARVQARAGRGVTVRLTAIMDVAPGAYAGTITVNSPGARASVSA